MQFRDVLVIVVKVDMAERGGWRAEGEGKQNFGRVQGLSVPFACVGSSDPVRVLRLYTTNTLDTLLSIYC